MKSLTWRIWSFKERWEIYKQLLKIITFFLLKEQVKRSCFPLTTTESVPERNGSRCRWEGGIFFLGLPALSALPYSPYSDGRQPCLHQRQRGNGVYRHWKHTHTHTFQPPPLKEILLNEPPVELSEPRWTKEGGEEDTGGYGSCWKQLAPVWSEGIWHVPSSSPSAQSFPQTWDQPEAGEGGGPRKKTLCDLAGVCQG